MKGKDTVNRSPVSSEDFRFLIDDSETYWEFRKKEARVDAGSRVVSSRESKAQVECGVWGGAQQQDMKILRNFLSRWEDNTYRTILKT